MKPLRVIFIEEDDILASRLKPHYQSLLRICGYEAEFFDAKGEGQARKLIDAHDPHVLICDLGYDKEYSGLHSIRTLRTHYPDLFVIGTSRGEYSPRKIDARQPSFHMFLDKQALLGGENKYFELARQRFQELFRLETNVRILNLDALKSEEFQKPAARRELVSLIRQVMFSGHFPDELLHPDEILLEPMSGGFSGSQVFKMTSRNSASGIVCVPSVLKVSEREYAEQELDNYQRFVKWGLPYTWRVDVLGYGTSRSYGAIAYSFILSDLKKFEPLTELLRRREDKRSLKIIGELFSPEMRRWYGDPLIREESNIVERYAGRYFRGTDSKGLSEKAFLAVAQAAFKARLVDNHLEIDGKRYELPSSALFGYPMGKYSSCVCHGDLNSNNVMVAENDQIIFIDFQETGRGHVFEDFVTMEASVRLYHGDSQLKVSELIAMERSVGDGDDIAGLSGAQLVAAEIRRLARRNFPSEPFSSYFYACAAFHLRLLRVKNLSEGQAQRVVAAILASLDGLALAR